MQLVLHVSRARCSGGFAMSIMSLESDSTECNRPNNKEPKVAKLDFNKIPKYSQLPIKPGAPAHSNWGVFGDDDEVGCFNFLTAEGITEAAKLIRDGKAFRLDKRIGYAEPPIKMQVQLGMF